MANDSPFIIITSHTHNIPRSSLGQILANILAHPNRHDNTAAPTLWSAWKPGLAMAVAGGLGYVLRDSPLLATCVAVGAFVVVAVATSAVPADAYHAFGLSRDRDDE